MKLDKKTQRAYVWLFLIVIIMAVNFCLYISTEPCQGPVSKCDFITQPNGTKTPVPQNEFAAVNKDPHPVLLFDIVMGLCLWTIALRHVLNQRKQILKCQP